MNNIPDGFFVNDLIFWGKSFSKNGILSKGFWVDVPDIRCFSTEQSYTFHDQLRSFLGELDPSYRIQIQWTVNSDYEYELDRYSQQNSKMDLSSNWTLFAREERLAYFNFKMREGTLRKEKLAVFLSHKCDTLTKRGLKTKEEINSFLEAENRSFEEKMDRFSSVMCLSSIRSMEDKAHYTYFSQFFEPSFEHGSYEMELDVEDSILENTLCSDGVFLQKDEDLFFKVGDYYHSIFVLRKWPKFVYPGIIIQLMDALSKDFRITQNLYPLNIEKEIRNEEKSIKHLSGNVQSGSASLAMTIEKKHKKINSLMGGYTMPYKVLTIIRTWGRSPEELFSQNVAIKTAIQNMNGAKFHQANQASQAKSLFFETFPGWTGGNRRGWDLYAENHELAALLPISNSFSGNLECAEALYEGENGNLVGVSSFVGGTPQHGVLIGMTGAGKSVATCDFLSQSAGFYDYTAIIEEGLSYGVFTKLMGCQPIIISPDSNLTINYLDTNGLPLTTSHFSVASKLCLKMIGISQDEDVNHYRTSIINDYLNTLYWNEFEDWKNQNEEKYKICLAEAYAIEKIIRPKMENGTSFLDGFQALKSLKIEKPFDYQKIIDDLDEVDLVAFENSSKDGIIVRNLAYAYFDRESFPVHQNLVDLMLFYREERHSREEIDYISAMLSSWSRNGDKGTLFDGVTNFKIDGRVTHFELGFIPESAKELKEASGFLISNFIRQHIIQMPRGVRKRIIFEEVSRFLDIPGGDVILSEAYAQLRKYSCWVLCVTQQFSQLKKTSLYKVVVGNSKLFFLMKQNQREDIEEIAEAIGLPDTSVNAIKSYILPEHQKNENTRCSYMTVFALGEKNNACGTIKIKPSKEMLYVASSDGRNFDNKTKALLKYKSVFEGVIQEVRKNR